MLGQWGAKLFTKTVEAVKDTAEFISNAPGEIAKTVKESTINAIEGTVDFMEQVYENPSGTTNKVWNSVTGRTTFEEAEDLLDQTKDKYDKAKFEYEKQMKIINSTLEFKLKKINYHKKDIFNNHFSRFTGLANKLHNLNIKGKSFLEYFDDSITEIKNSKGLRSKEELYEIDFNNLKISEIFLGTITLGFFTRKKAKETLNKVKKEASRIDEEVRRMKTHITQLNVVIESINNVADYFEVLITNYTNLLNRFEYGISSQIQKTILSGKKLENGKLDFKLMPVVHIEEFQALFNLSIVLKQMAIMGYLTEDGLNDEDIKSVKHIEQKVQDSQLLAA